MNTNTFAPESTSPADREIEPLPIGSRIVVVGAGAFGGWSALYLLRSGYRVTLIDAWGPGNSRSSSGDETRVIRSTYGSNKFYFDLNVRALQLWREHEKRWQKKLFQNKGVLWFCHEPTAPVVDASIPYARAHGMEYERWLPDEVRKKFPVINTSDLHHIYFDPHGGCLRAREACRAVHQAFMEEGGTYIQSLAVPETTGSGRLSSVKLSNGNTVQADLYVFACGAWLGKIFPDILGDIITCTRQEVYYFGVPYGKAEQFDRLPVWVDLDGKDFYYGIPGNQYRGFKVGVDKRGPVFDPTLHDRLPDQQILQQARQFLAHRFPDLKDAPLIENRVCQYENTPDGNFLFDQHPQLSNVMFLGGGSGHGFKHGPALGELVEQIIRGIAPIPGLFRMRR